MGFFADFTNRYNNSVTFTNQFMKKEELIEYIKANQLELNAEVLLEEYYVDPLGKNMYSIYEEATKIIKSDTLQYLIKTRHVLNSRIDYSTLHEKLFAALCEEAEKNPIRQLFKRFRCLYNPVTSLQFNGAGLDFFIIRNGLLCSNAIYDHALQSHPLTKSNFISLIIEDLRFYHYTQKDIMILWRRIKNFIDLPVYPKEWYLNRIYDHYGNYIRYEKKNIIFHRNINADFNFKRLPYFFEQRNHYSQWLLETLTKIINNSTSAFDHLARFVASAYSNTGPLKKATIIMTTPENLNEVKQFFYNIFGCAGKSFNLLRYADINATYEEQMTNNLNGVPVYFVEDGELPKNCDSLRKLVTAKYIYVSDENFGQIKFKNTIPLLLITANQEFAKEFSIQIPSSIIRTHSAPIKTDTLSEYDYVALNQSLTIQGLKLFGEKRQPVSTPVRVSERDAITEFIRHFCIFSKDIFIQKRIVKEAFKKFLTDRYPHLKLSSLAICNALRDNGCQIHSKKRIDGCENPVAVINGVTLNFEQYDLIMSHLHKYECNTIRKTFGSDELRVRLLEGRIDQSDA